jgi:hypothetical protein
MSESPIPCSRSDAVVRLLGAHEALSFGALRTLIVPAISEKRLRTVLTRLIAGRVVKRRLFNLCGGRASYFEVADPLRSDRGIGTVHNSLLMHNDLCAFAAETLQRMFPGAVCVREHAIPTCAQLRSVMRYKPKSRDSLPDILLVLPAQPGGCAAFVAVEIERSVKSSKRLLKKFHKYASRTSLDGVLYLSEDEGVLTALRQRYQSEVAGQARRVGHYKNHFLLTAACPTKQRLEIAQARTSSNSAMSLTEWMRVLTSVKLPDRRDEHFYCRGDDRPSSLGTAT